MKELKDGIISYDLTLVPDGLAVEELYHIMTKTGILFFDSQSSYARGYKIKPPYYITGATDKVFIDISDSSNRLKFDEILREIRNDKP